MDSYKTHIAMNRKIIPIWFDCLQVSRSPRWKVRPHCAQYLSFVSTDHEWAVFWRSNSIALLHHRCDLCVYYDVTGTRSRVQLSLNWSTQNTTHSRSVVTNDKYHVKCGRTFHTGDLEVWKQLSWIGIILVSMMICILKKSIDYLWNYQQKTSTLETAYWL